MSTLRSVAAMLLPALAMLVAGCGERSPPGDRELEERVARRAADKVLADLETRGYDAIAARVAERLGGGGAARVAPADEPPPGSAASERRDEPPPAGESPGPSVHRASGTGSPPPPAGGGLATAAPVPVSPSPEPSTPAPVPDPATPPRPTEPSPAAALPLTATPGPPPGTSPAAPVGGASGPGPGDDAVVLVVGEDPVTWGRLKQLAGYRDVKLDGSTIRAFVDDFVKFELLHRKALELEMERDPEYVYRLEAQRREYAARTLFTEEMARLGGVGDDAIREEYRRRIEYYSQREFAMVREFYAGRSGTLTELIAKLRPGVTFEMLREQSAVPGDVRASGAIKVRPGHYSYEVFQSVRSLDPQALTTPAPSEAGGFRTIRLLSYQPEKVLAYEEVKDAIRRELEGGRIEKALSTLEAAARAVFPVETHPERLGEADSATVLASVGGTRIRRDDLLRELAALPPPLRDRFQQEKGFRELFGKVVQKLLLARYAFEKHPTFARAHATALRDLARQELVRVFIQRHIVVRAKPDPAEVRKSYDARRGEYSVDQVRLRNISFRTPDRAAEPAALRRAQEVLDLLAGGQGFEELAKTRSEDEGTRQAGGDMGWLDTGNLIPAIRDEVDRLEPGQISRVPVLVRPQAFHVIKLDGRRTTRPFEDVADAIDAELSLEVQKKHLDQTVRELKLRWPVAIHFDRLPAPGPPAPAPETRVTLEPLLTGQGPPLPGGP